MQPNQRGSPPASAAAGYCAALRSIACPACAQILKWVQKCCTAHPMSGQVCFDFMLNESDGVLYCIECECQSPASNTCCARNVHTVNMIPAPLQVSSCIVNSCRRTVECQLHDGSRNMQATLGPAPTFSPFTMTSGYRWRSSSRRLQLLPLYFERISLWYAGFTFIRIQSCCYVHLNMVTACHRPSSMPV
jgi:hypothetical protein